MIASSLPIIPSVNGNQKEIVRSLQANYGVISRSQHPDLATSLDRMVRNGQLVAILPGIYVAAGTLRTPRLRMSAAHLWAPDCIFTGAAAVSLTFWREIEVPIVSLVVSQRRPRRDTDLNGAGSRRN